MRNIFEHRAREPSHHQHPSLPSPYKTHALSRRQTLLSKIAYTCALLGKPLSFGAAAWAVSDDDAMPISMSMASPGRVQQPRDCILRPPLSSSEMYSRSDHHTCFFREKISSMWLISCCMRQVPLPVSDRHRGICPRQGPSQWSWGIYSLKNPADVWIIRIMLKESHFIIKSMKYNGGGSWISFGHLLLLKCKMLRTYFSLWMAPVHVVGGIDGYRWVLCGISNVQDRARERHHPGLPREDYQASTSRGARIICGLLGGMSYIEPKPSSLFPHLVVASHSHSRTLNIFTHWARLYELHSHLTKITNKNYVPFIWISPSG